MDLPRFLRNININDAPPRAPHVLLYIPGGAAVHCPDTEAAQSAAENYAAERPGRTVGVYQLVGYAHKPIEKPAFQDTVQALETLLEATPESEIFTTPADQGIETDRTDLSPKQIEILKRIRAVTQ
jgi:hypothetical protein